MKTVTETRTGQVSFSLPWFCSQRASDSENGRVRSQTSLRLVRPGGSPTVGWGLFSLPADVTAVGWGKASGLLHGPAFRGWPRGVGVAGGQPGEAGVRGAGRSGLSACSWLLRNCFARRCRNTPSLWPVVSLLMACIIPAEGGCAAWGSGLIGQASHDPSRRGPVSLCVWPP